MARLYSRTYYWGRTRFFFVWDYWRWDWAHWRFDGNVHYAIGPLRIQRPWRKY